jgi:hypothetical protein
MSETTPLRRWCDEPLLDTSRLYDDLRAAGFDAHTSVRSVNYVLGIVYRPRRIEPT